MWLSKIKCNTVNAYITKGQLRRTEGDAKGSMQAFEITIILAKEEIGRQGKLIKKDSFEDMDDLSHFELARLYHELGNMPMAFGHYMKAAEQEPYQTINYIDRHLMEAHKNLQQLSDADADDMFSNATFGYYLMEIAKCMLGDRNGAEKDFKNVLILKLLLEAANQAMKDPFNE